MDTPLHSRDKGSVKTVGFFKANAQTDAYFKNFPKLYFLDGLKKLEKRLEKCIELKGDYVEK